MVFMQHNSGEVMLHGAKSLHITYSNCISELLETLVNWDISTQQMVALRSATDNLNSEHHIFLNVCTLTCTQCTNRNKQPNLNVQGCKQAAGNWKLETLGCFFEARVQKFKSVCIFSCV